MTRPNAIDLRVDQLSAHDLLTRSAAALVDPQRQIAAQRLVHWLLPGWLLSVILPIVALIYFWQSGRAARLRDFLRHRVRNEFLVRFYFGCVLGAIVQVAGLLPDLYDYRVDRLMGLSDQLLRAWGFDWLLGSIATMICIGLGAALVLALADRTHQWYLYTIAGIVAMSVICAFVAPYIAAPAFDRIIPLPPRMAAIAQAMEAQAGVQVPFEEVVRTRTHLGASYAIGLGTTERIVIGDAIFATASDPEIRYIMARQLGYVAELSTWKIAFTDALLVIFGAAIAVAIADRFPFRRDDDPVARLALVAGILALLYLIAVPIDNAVLRKLDANATRSAVGLGIDRAAAVRETIREADQRVEEVCPDVLDRLFLDRTLDASRTVSEINGVPSTCP